jgi:hypothetical protein
VFHSDHLAATQTLTNPETAVLLDRVGAVLSDQQGIGPFEQSLLALHYLGQVITAQAQALAFQDGFMLLAIGFGVAGVSALALAGKRRETAVPAAASSTAGHKAA